MKILKNRPKRRKMWKNQTKMSKKTVKNNKIKRITGNKHSQISKKCQKTLKKPSKTSKNFPKRRKSGKKS